MKYTVVTLVDKKEMEVKYFADWDEAETYASERIVDQNVIEAYVLDYVLKRNI